MHEMYARCRLQCRVKTDVASYIAFCASAILCHAGFPTVAFPELLQTSAETGFWLKPTVVLALSIGAVLALLLAGIAGLIVWRRKERRPFVAPELTRSGALKLGRASDGNVKFLLDSAGQPVLLGKGTSSEVSTVDVLCTFGRGQGS